MTPARILASIALASVLLLGSSLARADEPTAVIANVKRSIVAIGTYDRTRSPPFIFRGSGFAVEDGTLIVSNAHVIPTEGVSRQEKLGFLIPHPGASSATFREARQVAIDTNADLVLLKVDGEPLPALKLGKSDGVKEGQSVLFTGFPLGAALGPYPATHRGMVSAIAPIAIPQLRSGDLDPKVVRRLSAGSFDIFQLDGTAYPGSSGSPVYDPADGRVLAVVNMTYVKGTKEAALAQPSGISYAIPAKYVEELLAKAR